MDFKSYFQDELAYLRDVGDEFSRLNPKLAKYLSSSSTDPDIARLMEGFAFLTARLRMTLDDGLPEVTQSVLRMVWPNFVRPFPPLTLMKFAPVDRSITTRHPIERGTVIRSSLGQEDLYNFNTTAAFTLYPLEIADVTLVRSGERSVLRIGFATLSSLPLCDIGMEDLRLWFTGEKADAEMLGFWCSHHAKAVRVIDENGDRHTLPLFTVKPGGFGADEALMPGARPDFDGYRLLQEYFSYPQKFHCIDLTGLGQIFLRLTSATFSLEWEFDGPIPSEVTATKDTVCLYCTPAVNLFSVECGLSSEEVEGEYRRVNLAGMSQTEIDIFSVDAVSVWAQGDGSKEMRRFISPYASFEHAIEHSAGREEIYYKELASPRLTGIGADHLLQFVHHDNRSAGLSSRPIIAVTAFHNRGVTALQPGDIALPSQDLKSFVEPVNLTTPQPATFPPIDDERAWKFISNLTPLITDITTPEALAEALEVYDYPAASNRQSERASRRKLKAITAIETRPVDRLFKGRPIRGLTSIVTAHDAAFDTPGELYLFGQVLSEFLALYATANAFHKLEIRCADSGETFRYLEKNGRQPLL